MIVHRGLLLRVGVGWFVLGGAAEGSIGLPDVEGGAACVFGVLGFGEDEHGAEGDGDAVESDEAGLASIAGQEGMEGLSEEGALEPVVEDEGAEAKVGSCLGEGSAVVEDVGKEGLLLG